jgi:hypothetical protein
MSTIFEDKGHKSKDSFFNVYMRKTTVVITLMFLAAAAFNEKKS